MTRSEIREHIFRLVFRLEFLSEGDVRSQLPRYFEDGATSLFPDGSDGSDDVGPWVFDEEDKQYISEKYERIAAVLNKLDETINTHSRSWDTKRMGKVDLAILRLAVFEMLHDDDIPVGVAIDEAVELAKKYGQDESPSFINGVLAGIAKSEGGGPE